MKNFEQDSEKIDKRWLSLTEAIQYSPWGRDKLKRLAQEGFIQGAKDQTSNRGEWFFDRLSIDKALSGMIHGDKAQIEAEAFAIMKDAGVI